MVGYLESVKLQFDLQQPGAGARRRAPARSRHALAAPCCTAFNAAAAFRVRHAGQRRTPTATGAPPGSIARHAPCALRVLDVSVGGCALFAARPMSRRLQPQASSSNRRAAWSSTPMRAFDASLTPATRQRRHGQRPDSKGVRLGCAFVKLDGSGDNAALAAALHRPDAKEAAHAADRCVESAIKFAPAHRRQPT